jgi:hypothetical protein
MLSWVTGGVRTREPLVTSHLSGGRKEGVVRRRELLKTFLAAPAAFLVKPGEAAAARLFVGETPVVPVTQEMLMDARACLEEAYEPVSHFVVTERELRSFFAAQQDLLRRLVDAQTDAQKNMAKRGN